MVGLNLWVSGAFLTFFSYTFPETSTQKDKFSFLLFADYNILKQLYV